MKKKQKQTTTDPFTTAEKKQKRMRRFISRVDRMLVGAPEEQLSGEQRPF